MKLVHRLLAAHVECNLPNLVDLILPRPDSLELGLKHLHHALCDEDMNRHTAHVGIVLRQRVISAQLESAIFYGQVCAEHASAQTGIVVEVNVAEIETSRNVLEFDHGEGGVDSAIDALVGWGLRICEALDESVEVAGLQITQLVAQDQRAPLRLVERIEGGRIYLHDGWCRSHGLVLGVSDALEAAWLSEILERKLRGCG